MYEILYVFCCYKEWALLVLRLAHKGSNAENASLPWRTIDCGSQDMCRQSSASTAFALFKVVVGLSLRFQNSDTSWL